MNVLNILQYRQVRIVVTVLCLISSLSVCTAAAVAPSNVRATAESSTVISVQWDGLTPCRRINGLIVKYRVRYTAQPDGMTQSIDQTAAGDWRSGAETSLTGLTPSTRYSIQVAAVNEETDGGLFSDAIITMTRELICVRTTILLNIVNLVPEEPSISVNSVTSTSISLSWTSGGSEGVSYEVMWTSDECPDDVEDQGRYITSGTSYIIDNLREGSSYDITVSATDSAGAAPSDPVTEETTEVGE